MPLSAKQYQEAKNLLADPNAKLSEEDRTYFLTATNDFDNQHLQNWSAQPEPAQPPIEQRLDPNQELMPQALSAQPATTHKSGDESAEQEWLRSPTGAAKGTVFVYEPPLNQVKKRLLEDAAFTRALYPHQAPDPQRIAGLTKGDSEYQTAADYMWREAADAASTAGKTAYRYAKAPWLHEGGAMTGIRALGMKAAGSAVPIEQGIDSFILGVDDTALFGVMGAGARKLGGEEEAARQAEVKQESPRMNQAGAGLALLPSWTPANRLFSAVAGPVAGIAKGGGAVARTMGAAAGGAAGGVADAAVRRGVQSAEHGESPIPLSVDDAASELSGASLLPAALGAGLHVGGELAGAGANWVAHGARYGGNPGRFEAAGGQFETGKGPVASPEVQASVQRGRSMDVLPADVANKELAPIIAASTEGNVDRVIKLVKERKAPYLSGREGQMRLPATEVQTTALSILDKHHMPRGGTGKGKDALEQFTPSPEGIAKVREAFNKTVEGVSLKPVEGAIELTPQQAEAYLDARHQAALLPKAPKAAPKQPEPSAGAREVELPSAGKTPKQDPAGDRLEEAIREGKSGKEYTSYVGKDGGVHFKEVETPDVYWNMAHQKHMPTHGKGTVIDTVGHESSSLHPSDQRAEDLAKFMETHQGHITKAQAKQKLGFQGVPEYEVDKLVKDGRLEKVPPGEKQFGQVDAEYRVPKSQQGTVPPKGKEKKPAGAVAGKPQRDVTPTNLYPASNAARNEYGEASKPHREAQRADNARAARLADESGIPGVSSGEERPSLSESLGRRGISKVYVVPRRFTAEQHETLKSSLQTLADDPKTPGAREAHEMYVASLRDRDARPMNGEKGGWSRFQGENEKLIGAAKTEKKLLVNPGEAEPGFGALTDYAQQRPGQLPLVEAARAAAERSGVREQLDQVRLLDPLHSLQNQMSYGRTGNTVRSPMSPSALFDAATLRFGYPIAKKAAGPNSSIKGGRGGRFGTNRDDDEKEKSP